MSNVGGKISTRNQTSGCLADTGVRKITSVVN